MPQPAPPLTLALGFLCFFGFRLSLSARRHGPASWNNILCEPKQALSALNKQVLTESSPALESVTQHWGEEVSLVGLVSVLVLCCYCIKFPQTL